MKSSTSTMKYHHGAWWVTGTRQEVCNRYSVTTLLSPNPIAISPPSMSLPLSMSLSPPHHYRGPCPHHVPIATTIPCCNVNPNHYANLNMRRFLPRPLNYLLALNCPLALKMRHWPTPCSLGHITSFPTLCTNRFLSHGIAAKAIYNADPRPNPNPNPNQVSNTFHLMPPKASHVAAPHTGTGSPCFTYLYLYILPLPSRNLG